MKKRIIIVLGILIAAGGIGTGVWYHFYGNTQGKTGDSIVYVSKVSVISGTETAAVNRFAGVVEPQKTVNVKIESGRKVKEVEVKTGEEVKAGQLLFEYDLSSIEDDLKQSQLDLDRLKNEQISLTEQISTLEAEKKKAKADDQLSYTIEIETNKMNLKKNEYSQKSKQAEIDKLQSATQNTEVRSEIDGVIQKIDTSKMTSDDGDSVDDSSTMDSMSSNDDGSDSSAFITILSTGAYRVKGKVNEQNRDSVVPGESVIIRSRVDSSKTWKGTMGSIDMNKNVTAVVTLTLYSSAFLCEIVRGALNSVDMRQMEAAHALGMTKRQAYFRIIIPQAIIVALPNYFNFFLALLKGTSVVFTISVVDIMAAAKLQAEYGYRYIEAYTLVGFFYIILSIGFSQIFTRIEKNAKLHMGLAE